MVDTSDSDYRKAQQKIGEATRYNLTRLTLAFRGLTTIPPLVGLENLKELDLEGTQISDLAPLAHLSRLRSLFLRGTLVTDLAPIANLTTLQLLFLAQTLATDLAPLARLRALQWLDLAGTRVSDLSPLEGHQALKSLDLRNSCVSDLTPLANVTALIDGANSKNFLGLDYRGCPLKNSQLLEFSKLDKSERTKRAINYLRAQRGLPPYDPDKVTEQPLSLDAPKAIEGVPAPFDFAQTEQGTITVADSDTNMPAFPFATSREDHARRLEVCRVYAALLIKSLSERRYDNVRPEYLSYLQRYLEWLPQSTERGNMLLGDGMARSLAKLFTVEAEILPAGFATELHTLLEQHISACVYYPEVGTFNRDVRDGKPSRPFPLQAAEEFVKTVQAHTPQVFEPPVAHALSATKTMPPPLPAISADTPRPSPQTLKPPSIPGGETDPRKSREFATAATANRLWGRVHIAASVTTVAAGVGTAAHQLAPYASELIQWLADVLKSLPPS